MGIILAFFRRKCSKPEESETVLTEDQLSTYEVSAAPCYGGILSIIRFFFIFMLPTILLQMVPVQIVRVVRARAEVFSDRRLSTSSFYRATLCYRSDCHMPVVYRDDCMGQR